MKRGTDLAAPISSWRFLGCACMFVWAIGSVASASDCTPVPEPTFTVSLPKLGAVPAAENPEGWNLPLVWGDFDEDATSDSITVPNGRPIYALIISGYAINSHFDELLVYDFARHLMAQGAYVHWAWWNNLLAPYLQKPLHYNQSHPGTAANLADFATPAEAQTKALPADDYQFIADAKLFLSAIRANNPEAIIVIVGHSMGGASCARLARQTGVLIDLAAPIDPVGNRNYPWAGPSANEEPFYNWTRWRATRGFFHGFEAQKFLLFPLPPPGCTPQAPWYKTFGEAQAQQLIIDTGCTVYVDPDDAMNLQSNIINLWHGWQHEAAFPFDFDAAPEFVTNPPPGGSEIQGIIGTQSAGFETGGWPNPNLGGDCCPIGVGVAWPLDGHGEVIGTRGPVTATRPLGTRVRTSPYCNGCPNTDWPARTGTVGNWNNGDSGLRMLLMQDLETLPLVPEWENAPYNPALCKVSPLLISRFESMNKPPIANAGGDRTVVCDNCISAPVTLDGAGSSDPENSVLQYAWTWNGGSANGAVANVVLPYGPTCVTLEVTDAAGHVKFDHAKITVLDPSAAVLPYTSSAMIWKLAVGQHVSYAFDMFYPGIANNTGCLLSPPLNPAVIQLNGGTMTVTAHTGATPYCAINDSGTTPAVSDALINNNSMVEFDFDPPVTAFYTYFGSLAVGQSATMTLYSDINGKPVDTVTSPPSTHATLASGLGFTSTAPIKRIEFTATEAGPVLIGAFTGLKAGEQSLGTINLPGYAGPDGSVVERDFGLVFVDQCPADIAPSGGNGTINVDDLLAVINAWGQCPAPPNSCPANIVHLAGEPTVNVDDLLAVINAWGVCP